MYTSIDATNLFELVKITLVRKEKVELGRDLTDFLPILYDNLAMFPDAIYMCT